MKVVVRVDFVFDPEEYNTGYSQDHPHILAARIAEAFLHGETDMPEHEIMSIEDLSELEIEEVTQ